MDAEKGLGSLIVDEREIARNTVEEVFEYNILGVPFKWWVVGSVVMGLVINVVKKN